MHVVAWVHGSGGEVPQPSMLCLVVRFADASMPRHLALFLLVVWPAAALSAGEPSPACAADRAAASYLLAPDTDLATLRCLARSGRAALAAILLQRRVAENPADAEAAELLAELAARHAVATAPTPVRQTRAWWAAEAGVDSNINRATPARVIDIPLLNYRSLTLPDLLVQQSSTFIGASGGAVTAWQPAPDLRLILAGAARSRVNAAQTSYLPHDYGIYARVEQEHGGSTRSLAASAAQQWLAGYRLIERTALRGALSRRFDEAWQGGLAIELARNAYPWFDGLRSDESTLELSAGIRPLNLRITANVGEERSRTAVKDLDRRYETVMLAWRKALDATLTLKLDAAVNRSHYRQFSRLFNTDRRDTRADIELAVTLELDRDWSLTPALQWESSRSTIALNDYRRSQYRVELRREF